MPGREQYFPFFWSTVLQSALNSRKKKDVDRKLLFAAFPMEYVGRDNDCGAAYYKGWI